MFIFYFPFVRFYSISTLHVTRGQKGKKERESDMKSLQSGSRFSFNSDLDHTSSKVVCW